MIFFSIVVCTKNGASTIFESLHSILHLKKTNDIEYELIIVDNGSTDNTMSIAREFLKKHKNQLPITIYYEANVGKTHAINLAVTKAKFDFILLCDDDNILSDNYLIESKKIIDQLPHLGVLGGNSEFKYQNYVVPKWFNKYSHLYSVGVQSHVNNCLISEVTNLWGAGMIFRKDIYQWLISKKFNLYTGISQYGIYLAGEDYELCLISNILGFKNYYSSKLRLVHNINPNRLKWKSTKSLIIRNSLVTIYMSLYRYFILNSNRNIESIYFKRHLFYLFYKSLIRLFISSLKHIIGFFISLEEGFSYQLDFRIALAEQKLIFNLYKNRHRVLIDLIYKKNTLNQFPIV